MEKTPMIPFFPIFPTIAIASWFELAMFWTLVAGLTIILLNDFAFIPFAIIQNRSQEPHPDPGYQPLVTVLVPAHNEEKTVGNLLDTLMEQSYRNLEILVINDGSTDHTSQVARDRPRDKVQVIDLPPPNSGKYAALNYGLAIANGEIVVVMDADGVAEHDCINRLVAAMQAPNVCAVAGNVKVANRINVITKLQALEYVRDINIPRRIFDLLGVAVVIPGPLGAFRKTYLQTVGGYDPDTVTEDFDATVKVQKVKNRATAVVKNSTSAVSYTEAPENVRDLVKQRKRWYGGMTQTMIKHWDRRLLLHSGVYSSTVVPYLYLNMFVIPILELVMAGLGTSLVLLTGGTWGLGVLAVFVILETVASALALRMDKEKLRLAAYSPLFILGYRQLMDAIRVYAFYKAKYGRMTWTKSRRYGNIQEKAKTAIT